MPETLYPLMPANASTYHLLVQRQETFFADKLTLIADNKPLLQWSVHSLNLKGKKPFTYDGMSMEIHWQWALSGQPKNFNVYHLGMVIAHYSEPRPLGMVEALSRYILPLAGLPTTNRITNQGIISRSCGAIGLLLSVTIMGIILGWKMFDSDFNFGDFLLLGAILIASFTLIGLLIDIIRVQWYRFRNKA